MKNRFKILLAFVAIASFAFISPRNDANKQITVVIDAGHGGKDHGVAIEGFTEKDIVSQITNKIIEQNSNKNVTIHLTRSGDDFLSLEERIAFINKIQPDLVLSLHVNGLKNTDASGIEFFVSPTNVAFEESKTMAKKLNEIMTQKHNVRTRGVKEASFMMLKKSEFPAVTFELGFLSNENDRNFLTDDAQQDKVAATILEFLSGLK